MVYCPEIGLHIYSKSMKYHKLKKVSKLSRDNIYLKYDNQFKLECVLDYLDSDLTINQVVRKYNINGRTNLNRWVKLFKDGKFETHQLNNMATKHKKILLIEKELRKLTRELKQTQMELLAYRKLVDITEQEFNLPIRKKYGSKQSKN